MLIFFLIIAYSICRDTPDNLYVRPNAVFGGAARFLNESNTKSNVQSYELQNKIYILDGINIILSLKNQILRNDENKGFCLSSIETYILYKKALKIINNLPDKIKNKLYVIFSNIIPFDKYMECCPFGNGQINIYNSNEKAETAYVLENQNTGSTELKFYPANINLRRNHLSYYERNYKTANDEGISDLLRDFRSSKKYLLKFLRQKLYYKLHKKHFTLEKPNIPYFVQYLMRVKMNYNLNIRITHLENYISRINAQEIMARYTTNDKVMKEHLDDLSTNERARDDYYALFLTGYHNKKLSLKDPIQDNENYSFDTYSNLTNYLKTKNAFLITGDQGKDFFHIHDYDQNGNIILKRANDKDYLYDYRKTCKFNVYKLKGDKKYYVRCNKNKFMNTQDIVLNYDYSRLEFNFDNSKTRNPQIDKLYVYDSNYNSDGTCKTQNKNRNKPLIDGKYFYIYPGFIFFHVGDSLNDLFL